MTKKIKIEIVKDVYWEDWGTMRKVFKKGWIGWVTGYFEYGELVGVSDEIWDDCYKVLEQDQADEN